MSSTTRLRRAPRGLLIAVLVLSSMVWIERSNSAEANGSPDVSVAASTPGLVLYGAPIPITVTATNAGGPDGYNLSFRDVLPVGVSYAASSAPIDPIEILRGDGTTALIWDNVADLLAGAISLGILDHLRARGRM